MRLPTLIIILLICCSAYAQQTEAPDLFETASFSSERRILRTGISFRRDEPVYERYFWKANLLIPTYRSSAQWGISAQWQFLANNPFLLLILEGSFQRDVAVFDERDMLGVLHNYNGPDFEESFTYHRFGLSPGIQIEPFADYGLSPYFNGKCLAVFPTKMLYEYTVTASNNIPNLPTLVTIENGAKMSVGWEIEVGFRADLNPHATFMIGFYYQELEQKVNWPAIESREISDTVLGFNRLGFITGLAYTW